MNTAYKVHTDDLDTHCKNLEAENHRLRELHLERTRLTESVIHERDELIKENKRLKEQKELLMPMLSRASTFLPFDHRFVRQECGEVLHKVRQMDAT